MNIFFLGAAAEGAVDPGALLRQVPITKISGARPKVFVFIFDSSIHVESGPFFLDSLHKIWDRDLGKSVVLQGAKQLQLGIASGYRIYGETNCFSLDWRIGEEERPTDTHGLNNCGALAGIFYDERQGQLLVGGE